MSAPIAAFDIAIVGAGPAGLMAAESCLAAGLRVAIFDRMGSAGRKFLVAGVGGLNLTHAEPMERFITRYQFDASEAELGRAMLSHWLQEFPPQALRDFAQSLGIATMVGSSNRVFPNDLKAAPMMRRWLARLKQAGLQMFTHHYCTDISNSADGWLLNFSQETQSKQVSSRAVVLALGGGSWRKVGSDGSWLPWLRTLGVPCFDLLASNCGFVMQLSEHLKKHAGAPIKPVSLFGQKGELMLSEYGLEGSLIYAYSHRIREQIKSQGFAEIALDLLPDHADHRLLASLQAQASKRSLSERIRRAFAWSEVKHALFFESLPPLVRNDAQLLVARAKALPIKLSSARDIDEAISTAGGVALSAMTPTLMSKTHPGLFCCGEMLAWDAPTGGYLLSACFASGHVAGQGVVNFLS